MARRKPQDKDKPDLNGFNDYDTSAAESWKPEEQGDWIKGVIKRKKEDIKITVRGKTQERNLMILDTDNGDKCVWISAMLEDFFHEVVEGQEIYIEYDGKKSIGGGQSMNQFKVMVRDA